MKRPGDGWVIIDWHICPFCGKKGYYEKYGDGGQPEKEELSENIKKTL
jgi:hypothetical protein